METVDADVIIVGSGVAGSLTAYKLAQAGLSVIILESGPYITSREKHVEKYRSSLLKTPESAYFDNPMSPRPTSDNPNGYYIQAGRETFTSTYERVVGGSTWHWLGTALRLLPEDFKMYSKYQQAADWPLDYSELESFYSLAEHELKVSGNSQYDLGSPRKKDYFSSEIKQSYLDTVLHKSLLGRKIDGISLDVRATPQARASWCQGNASCIPICPIGAKYDATQHVDMATKLGVKVIDKAVVHRLDVDANQKVEAVRYLDWHGKEHKVFGRCYVLAANAIETPKILLMSKSKYTPNGVANSSDLVGRNLMDHPAYLSWALTKEPLYPFRGPLSTSGIETTRHGDFRTKRAAFRIEIGNDGWWWPTGAPNTDSIELINRNSYGTELKLDLKNRIQHQLRLTGLVEQLPNKNNRVTLSQGHLDKLGLPRPEISYQIGDYERLALVKVKQFHDYIFDTLGVSEVHHHEGYVGSGHIMGTYKMGTDAQTSVVNADSRSHDHQNLFLLGSGVFPSVGAANPSLTIAALALFAVESILKDFGQIRTSKQV
ncbi:GMC family oxidoreductase [uncultured Shewanella sp.]|uniref:GMC family oxidoreductase n=1 Tax=uncultured Shewanella sp. TaxID=173975 RepID=UPI00260D0CB0|nr:GMC family oxidoreductase [uncultured Shewanella sp.]